MKKTMMTLLTGGLALSLVACAGPGQSGISNTTGGALAGGALGGILASTVSRGNVPAVIGGTLLGGFLGSRVGSSMDSNDQMQMQQAMQRREASEWRSRRGERYAVNSPYITNSGRLCRRIEMTDNSGELIEGTSCCSRMVHSRCKAWRMES